MLSNGVRIPHDQHTNAYLLNAWSIQSYIVTVWKDYIDDKFKPRTDKREILSSQKAFLSDGAEAVNKNICSVNY